jgi:hypothetical protein
MEQCSGVTVGHRWLEAALSSTPRTVVTMEGIARAHVSA